MKTKKQIQNKFNYLFDLWKEEHNPEHAVQILAMIEDRQLVVKALEAKLVFLPASKSQFPGKCDGCNKQYQKGTPIFLNGVKGDLVKYHEFCAPDEFRATPYYLKCKENETKETVITNVFTGERIVLNEDEKAS